MAKKKTAKKADKADNPITAVEENDDLVLVEKGHRQLPINRRCLDDHVRRGWRQISE